MSMIGKPEWEKRWKKMIPVRNHSWRLLVLQNDWLIDWLIGSLFHLLLVEMNLERCVSGGCFLDVWVKKRHAVEFARLITAHTVCVRLTNLICGLLVLKPQTICSLLFTAPSLETTGTKLCCCFSRSLAYLWQQQQKKKKGVNLTKDLQIQCKSRSTRAEVLVFHHRWCKDERRNSRHKH